ncbi:hypothetical protein CPB86DRAFT_485018, partial [Serendipita vermifera]
TLKKSLRQVCKAWKDIIDSIRTDYQRVREHKYRNRRLFEENERPTILDTRDYTMVTVDTEVFSVQKALIKFRYTHPASALTMRTIPPSYFQSRTPLTQVKSLSDIVSFPKQLKVLNLYMDGSNAPMDLLRGVQEMSIPLTTLSLFLMDTLILRTRITIPTLVNLFISIPSRREESIWADPSRYQWKLPALRNLSLGQSQDGNAWNSLHWTIPTHPFYIELLKRHKLNLRSLLMDPMTAQVHNQSSPVWWITMPNLQVLATNFCNVSPAPGGGLNLLWTPKSTSVRHLIHFDDGGFRTWMGSDLCGYIRLCTRLESVILVTRGTAVKWMTVDPVASMTDLRDLCIKRGIPIWSQSDVLEPRKIVTFGPR